MNVGDCYKVHDYDSCKFIMVLMSKDKDWENPSDNNEYWKCALFQIGEKSLFGAFIRYFTDNEIETHYVKTEKLENINSFL